MKNMKFSVLKTKKVFEKFNLETPKTISVDEFVCLKSKMYSFKCGDKNRKKLKGTSKSQSKHIKFEEFEKCSDGEEYQQECDKFFLQSFNHERYLQQIRKSTLSFFDD